MVSAPRPSCASPVTRHPSLFLAFEVCLAGALLVSGLSTAAEPLPEYQIGDIVKEDIVSPVPLVVIDPDETAALKEKEALKVQITCRYNTNVINQVEEDFHAAFANTRSNFLIAVEGFFNSQKLGEEALSSPKYQRLAASFQRQNKSFPLTTNLARLWAQGEPDRVLESSLAARLGEAMSRPLRAPALPQGIVLTFSVRIVPIADWNEPITLEAAEKRGKALQRTNLIVVGRARTELRDLFGEEDAPVGKFLASLLRTNCGVDLELTRQARAKRTDPLWAADRYEAGQIIVQRGQVIDKKIKAALDQLHEKMAAGNLQQLIQDDQLKAEQTKVRNRWIAAGSVVVFLVSVGAVWRLSRRKPVGSLLPARVLREETGAIVVSCPACDEIIVVPQLTSDVPIPPSNPHEWLLPHLARVLRDKFVRKLLSHRSHLLDTQEKAAADVAELEERLAKLHAPLQERLRAYEQRIFDLEKELAQKGEENRELIKAKIQLTKEHFEAAKEWVEVN